MGVRFDRSIVIARGKNKEAMEFAANVSTYIGELTGVSLTWGLAIGGTAGKVHWYADYENMAGLEAVLGQTMNDDGYQALLDSAVDAFVGAAEDTLVYTM